MTGEVHLIKCTQLTQPLLQCICQSNWQTPWIINRITFEQKFLTFTWPPYMFALTSFHLICSYLAVFSYLVVSCCVLSFLSCRVRCCDVRPQRIGIPRTTKNAMCHPSNNWRRGLINTPYQYNLSTYSTNTIADGGFVLVHSQQPNLNLGLLYQQLPYPHHDPITASYLLTSLVPCPCPLSLATTGRRVERDRHETSLPVQRGRVHPRPHEGHITSQPQPQSQTQSQTQVALILVDLSHLI